MAYVYADMDALAAYQQQIVQTLSALEGQIGCKEDLIEDTKQKLRTAIRHAQEREDTAYTAMKAAQERLYEAQERTRSYNANLSEGQEPITTPEYYYEAAEEAEQEHTYAEAARVHAEETLAGFEAYVRSYEQQQQDGINHFKKLLSRSGSFFEAYIQKLIEVKKATAVSGGSVSGRAGTEAGEPAAPDLSVQEAGRLWTDALPKDQYAALCSYTGSAYMNINATLRGISPAFEAGCREKAALIHQALSACRIPQACTVYRGASAAALGPLRDLPDGQLVGAFISDNGFMSTSIDPKDAFSGEVRLEIEVPAGAKGAYVGYLSHLGHSESEVLFDMGQILRITKVTRDSNGHRVVHAKMMI